METEKNILGLTKALFWDVDPQTVDLQKHASYIIERVLTRGTWEEFKRILNYYGREKIIHEVTNLSYVDRNTVAFCSVYFNISKKRFRCYTNRQLRKSHWNY